MRRRAATSARRTGARMAQGGRRAAGECAREPRADVDAHRAQFCAETAQEREERRDETMPVGPSWGRREWRWFRDVRCAQEAHTEPARPLRPGDEACTCASVHRRTWQCAGARADPELASASPERVASVSCMRDGAPRTLRRPPLDEMAARAAAAELTAMRFGYGRPCATRDAEQVRALDEWAARDAACAARRAEHAAQAAQAAASKMVADAANERLAARARDRAAAEEAARLRAQVAQLHAMSMQYAAELQGELQCDVRRSAASAAATVEADMMT